MRDSPAPFEGLVDNDHQVWDLFLRLFHWTLLVAVATALVSGFLLDSSWIRLHLVSGVAAAALIAARIVWGFTGPTYARFSQFLPRPRHVVGHLKAGAHHARHLGHNPLGALMVLALLGLLLALALTGAALLGSGLKTGPVAFALSATQAPFWSQVHEVTAFALLALIILHVAGVAFESLRSRENLTRSMVTGRKPTRTGDTVAPLRPAKPVLAAVLVAAVLATVTAGAAGLSRIALPSPPVANLPAIYIEECAACHMAYHPSTRPTASWTVMMSRLEDHFGEDASLPGDTTAEIAGWLASHAAETTDSKPAMLWRGLVENTPVALPDTRVWKELHGSLDEQVFKRRTIYSRSNCAACHADAETGWHSQFDIIIPKETLK